MSDPTVGVTIKLNPADQTFDFNLNTDHSVEQVVDTLLQIHTDYEKDHCYIVRKGRILKNDQVVKDLGIKAGETLQFVNKKVCDNLMNIFNIGWCQKGRC